MNEPISSMQQTRFIPRCGVTGVYFNKDDEHDYSLLTKQRRTASYEDEDEQISPNEAHNTQDARHGIRFNTTTSRKCYNCGQKGHMANRCPSACKTSSLKQSRLSNAGSSSNTRQLPLNKDRRQPRQDQVSYMSAIDLEVDTDDEEISESALSVGSSNG